jgi:hypothetical protein
VIAKSHIPSIKACSLPCHYHGSKNKFQLSLSSLHEFSLTESKGEPWYQGILRNIASRLPASTIQEKIWMEQRASTGSQNTIILIVGWVMSPSEKRRVQVQLIWTWPYFVIGVLKM